jgi:hypothetical protein
MLRSVIRSKLIFEALKIADYVLDSLVYLVVELAYHAQLLRNLFLVV